MSIFKGIVHDTIILFSVLLLLCVYEVYVCS